MNSTPSNSLPLALPNPKRREELRREFQQANSWLLYEPHKRSEAIATLISCVQGDPGNGIFVETLLRQLRSQAPRSRSWLEWFVRKEDKLPAASDWQREWNELWQKLRDQPRQWEVAAGLGRLAEQAGFAEVEVHCRRYAAEVGGAAVQPRIDLATMFVRQGSLEEAAALWQAIGRENLSSAPAQRFAACWQADIPVWPLSLPATVAEEKQTFWHQFNATLQAAEFAIAQQQLTQFAQQLGNPPWLAEWQEVLFLFRAEHALRVGQALLDDPLIPTRTETIDLLRGELLRRELDQFTRQAERQPERLEWSWEVAVRLKQLGNFSAAIQSLEPLVSQPAWQGAACLELAECWQRLRQFEKALRYYRQCIMAEVVTAEIRNRGLNQGQRLAAHLGQEDWPG